MGKKSAKRKTRWRALSIGDTPSDGESGQRTGHSVDRGVGGLRYAHKTPRSFSSHSNPNKRYGGQNGHYSTKIDDRPYYDRSHTTNGSTSKYAIPKLTFNEDEYTRITTPRQDVLFKKGYLSRRKPLDTGSTAGGADTVTSNSTSTTSTQSASPEHHIVDSCDGGQIILDEKCMFPNGFVDQNGIYFVNPSLPFDGFGPVMMLPYGGFPLFNNHLEYMNTPGMYYQDPLASAHKCTNIDSQQTNTPETSSPQNELALNADTSDENKDVPDTGVENTDQTGGFNANDPINSNGVHTAHDTRMFLQNSFPLHYVYPGYMFGPQMYHVDGVGNIQCSSGLAIGATDTTTKRYKKKRRRKPAKTSGSVGSAGAGTTDEDFSSDSEPSIYPSHRPSIESSVESATCDRYCDTKDISERKQFYFDTSSHLLPISADNSVLNTNCSEFIPQAAKNIIQSSHLNTEVNEFIPKKFNQEPKNAFEKQIEKFLSPESPKQNPVVSPALEMFTSQKIEEKYSRLENMNDSLAVEKEKNAISHNVQSIPLPKVNIDLEWKTVKNSRFKGKRRQELPIVPWPCDRESSEMSEISLDRSPNKTITADALSFPIDPLPGDVNASIAVCDNVIFDKPDAKKTISEIGRNKSKNKSKNKIKQTPVKKSTNTKNGIIKLNGETGKIKVLKRKGKNDVVDGLEPRKENPMLFNGCAQSFVEISTTEVKVSSILEHIFDVSPDKVLEKTNYVCSTPAQPAAEIAVISEGNSVDEVISGVQVTEEVSNQDNINLQEHVRLPEEERCILDNVCEFYESPHPNCETKESKTTTADSLLPITMAVTRWLDEQKEKSPAPVLRIPDDPELTQKITGLSLKIHDDQAEWTSSETDSESEATKEKCIQNSKNAIGNPLRAQSVSSTNLKNGRDSITIDTDSDYLSDVQEDARKRVANNLSEKDQICYGQRENDETEDSTVSTKLDALPYSCSTPGIIKEVHVEQAKDVLEAYESVDSDTPNHKDLYDNNGRSQIQQDNRLPPPYNGICCTVM